MRKAVHRLQREGRLGSLSGAENSARWQAMLSEIDERDRAAEQRLRDAERALNRLTLN